MIQIKQGFEEKINSINPTISTVYEGTTLAPTTGIAYQELYLIPATNDDYLDSGYVSKGIFQITLKYPTGKGTKDILDRIKLYLDNFPASTRMVKDSITVRVINTPKVVNLGSSGDRIIYAISINYEAFY